MKPPRAMMMMILMAWNPIPTLKKYPPMTAEDYLAWRINANFATY